MTTFPRDAVIDRKTFKAEKNSSTPIWVTKPNKRTTLKISQPPGYNIHQTNEYKTGFVLIRDVGILGVLHVYKYKRVSFYKKLFQQKFKPFTNLPTPLTPLGLRHM